MLNLVLLSATVLFPTPTDRHWVELETSLPMDAPIRHPQPGREVNERFALMLLAHQKQLLKFNDFEWTYSSYERMIDVVRCNRIILADCPRLEECEHLPSFDEIWQVWRYGVCFRNKAIDHARRYENPVFLYRAAYCQIMMDVWDFAWYARNKSNCWMTRRVSLKRLRDAIGEEAYLRGELPPITPDWLYDPAPSDWKPRDDPQP